ncbi:hypothetical protein THRCLA_02019 [Thraustotheca clavata]|uniref:Uncharacterized protein n=1 Tax=Thraustotheca clavata TaxID=74557 RepID=A0A1W0A6T3_9STRA|nr:hypothetical protein THRCLA_02019 [Thraustotheca clavata]
MVMLPMDKVGGMFIRVLTKPIANELKSLGKSHPWLKQACTSLGQRINRWNIISHLRVASQGHLTINVKDLPDDKALEKGTEFIGEVFIFAVAVAVVTYDYTRSTKKNELKEAQLVQAEYDKYMAMEERFRYLEKTLHGSKQECDQLMKTMEQVNKLK